MLEQKKDNYSLKKNIIETIKFAFTWGLGYASIWLAKWIIVDIFFQKGMIKLAIQQVFERSIKYKVSYKKVLKRNTVLINKELTEMLIILSVLFLLYRMYFKNYKKQTIKNIIPYTLIIMLPLGWLFTIRDHSCMHSFFTYRNMIILVMNIPIIILTLFSKEKTEDNNLQKLYEIGPGGKNE